MTQLSDKERELIATIYSIEITNKEITNKYKAVEERYTKNYECITKMRDYEQKGYTIDPPLLKELLETDADIKQKQREALAKLLDINEQTKQIKDDLRDLSSKYDHTLKPKSIVTQRKKVWIR